MVVHRWMKPVIRQALEATLQVTIAPSGRALAFFVDGYKVTVHPSFAGEWVVFSVRLGDLVGSSWRFHEADAAVEFLARYLEHLQRTSPRA